MKKSSCTNIAETYFLMYWSVQVTDMGLLVKYGML